MIGMLSHARSGIVLSLLFFFLVNCPIAAYAQDLEKVVAGVQRRYASVETIAGDFKQIYRAPGIESEESGTFRLKRPGLMRWEYQSPEEKLFIADGRESFSYIPQDRKVTIQPFSASDLHNTPLELLLGRGDINKNYIASWEAEYQQQVERTYIIRLTPREGMTAYSFVVLELDQKTYDLRRILVRETGNKTNEFFLTNLTTNIKFKNKEFRFKTPKGVKEIRLTDEDLF